MHFSPCDDFDYAFSMKVLRYSLFFLAMCITTVQSWANPFRLPMQPARLAKLETEMWRAYYEQDFAHLSYRIYQLFTEEFTLSLSSSLRAAYHATKAASIMRSLPGTTSKQEYRTQILPNLTEFFEVIKHDLNAEYDSQSVATAELDWWITRRTHEHNDIKKIGLQIAKVYSLMTARDNENIRRAGILRAHAAWLRDQQQINKGRVNWQQIESLLKQSYENLSTGFNHN